MKATIFCPIFLAFIFNQRADPIRSGNLREKADETIAIRTSKSDDTIEAKYRVLSVSLDSLFITREIFIYKGMKIRLPKLAKADQEFDEITWAEEYPVRDRPDSIYAKPSFGGKKYRVKEIWSNTYNGKEFWYDVVLKGKSTGVLICDVIYSTWNGELKIRGYTSPRTKLIMLLQKNKISQQQFWNKLVELGDQIPRALPQ